MQLKFERKSVMKLASSVFIVLLLSLGGTAKTEASANTVLLSQDNSGLLRCISPKPNPNFGFYEATIEKGSNWYSQSFDQFLGNNLINKQISSSTSKIRITRYFKNYSKIYDVSIIDSQTGRVHSSNTFYRGYLSVDLLLSARLEAGKNYSVFVKECDRWGRYTGVNYSIGYFGVYKDQGEKPQPPDPLTKPKLNTITDKDYLITGTAEPNSTIYLTVGTEHYRGTVDGGGLFSITLEKPYPAGTGVEAYTINKNGGTSDSTITIIKESVGELGVNPIYSSDSVITGRTVPNVLLEASVDNQLVRAHIFEGTSDSRGYYSIDLRGRTYPAGTQITVTMFRANGEQTSKHVIVYPRLPSINTINEGDWVVTGTADPKATVTVFINGIEKYRDTVDAAGKFRVALDDPLVQGDTVKVSQESNGITSEIVLVTVQ